MLKMMNIRKTIRIISKPELKVSTHLGSISHNILGGSNRMFPLKITIYIHLPSLLGWTKEPHRIFCHFKHLFPFLTSKRLKHLCGISRFLVTSNGCFMFFAYYFLKDEPMEQLDITWKIQVIVEDSLPTKVIDYHSHPKIRWYLSSWCKCVRPL